jgi:hypothetical protein
VNGRLRKAILQAVAARGADKTICSSEVARAASPGGDTWHELMPGVRAEAHRLQADGLIDVMQKGEPVDPLSAKGPIRLGLPSKS